MKKLILVAGLLSHSNLFAQPMGHGGATSPQQGQRPMPPQHHQGPQQSGPAHEIFSHLFPPDLVERFQNQLGLSADQKKKIMDLILNSQKQILESRWNSTSAMEDFVKSLKSGASSEEQIQKHEALLASEALIKRINMNLLIQIKSVLTKQQQSTLKELREQAEKDRDVGR